MLTRLLYRALRPYRRAVCLVVVLLAIQTLGTLYLPNLNADIINNGVLEGNLHYIVHTGEIMLGITLVLGMISIVAVYFASRTAMGVGADLRGEVFRAVQDFSQRDIDRFGTPSLITRNTNDVQQIQLFVQMALTLMVMAPIMCVGGILLAIHEGAALSPLLAVSMPLMLACIGIVLAVVVPQFRTMQVKIDRINQVLREQITGVRVIRAFVRSDPEAERFAEANGALTSTALRVNRVFALTMPILMIILQFSSVAVLYFGGRLVADGRMPIGNLTAFLTYILQILLSVMLAVMVAILQPRAVASAERITAVVETVPSIGDPAVARRSAERRGRVAFEAVTFSYPGGEQPVLRDVSFVVDPGHTTGIIGGTGSGKSTLMQLVTRQYDASEGRITLDGLDVRDLGLEDLWAHLGLVPQTAYLFSGTVASNLRIGRPEATEAELWHALEVAQASDFVAAMPGGIDAAIDQGGTNVSGGQRQRLSIARALVRRPSVYLFDDCFSALDAQTDARLREALRAETVSSSVLIVAQRVSTIMAADEIVVLDEGAVVGAGTHAELVETCPAYREIVVSQLGEEAA